MHALTPRTALPVLLLALAPLWGCDDDGSCKPGCRPSADGTGVDVTLPCEGDVFTEDEPCIETFNKVEVVNDAGETETYCTDVVLRRCALRRYPGGEQYRICVVDAPVVGASTLAADDDGSGCEAVVVRTAPPPDDDPDAEPQTERVCVDCDHWSINVRVDRRKTEDEMPPAVDGEEPACVPAPENFCSIADIGYDYCAYETMGCNWPPSPYL